MRVQGRNCIRHLCTCVYGIYESKFLGLICALNSIICTTTTKSQDPLPFNGQQQFSGVELIRRCGCLQRLFMNILLVFYQLPVECTTAWETATDTDSESALSVRSLFTCVYSVGRIRLAIRQCLRGSYVLRADISSGTLECVKA